MCEVDGVVADCCGDDDGSVALRDVDAVADDAGALADSDGDADCGGVLGDADCAKLDDATVDIDGANELDALGMDADFDVDGVDDGAAVEGDGVADTPVQVPYVA